MKFVNNKWRRRNHATAVLLFFFAFAGTALAQKDSKTVEQNDRTVDEAAIDLKKSSILVLSKLIERSRDQPKESALLMRKADTLADMAQIEFRIAHGKAIKTGTPPDLAAFQKTMETAIATLSSLITRFPQDANIGHALYLRANAYRETKKTELAISEYKQLLARFPAHPERFLSLQALSQLLIDKKAYADALTYLKPLMTNTSGYQAFAYDKASTCYFYLNDINSAISYANRALNAAEGTRSEVISVNSEGYLKNIALFYFSGFERKVPVNSLEKALDTFTGLQRGSSLGVIVVQFSMLLRSKGYNKEYVSFTDTAVRRNLIDSPRHLELLLANFDYFKNKAAYPEMLDAAKSAVSVVQNEKTKSKESMQANAAKIFSEIAMSLQGHIVKGATPDPYIANTLTKLYETMASSGFYDDKSLPGIYFNLAETYFAQKNFEGADKYYKLAGKISTDPSIRLKALAAKTEKFKLTGVIPNNLQAVSTKTAATQEIDSEMKEWAKSVDELSKELKGSDTMVPFQFEVSRMLYAKGYVGAALKRMQALIAANPRSRYAVAALTLSIDTLLATEDWEACQAMINSGRSRVEWQGNQELQAKLEKISREVSFKQTEAAYQRKEYAKIIEAGNRVLNNGGNFSAPAEILAMAANSALSMGNARLAQKFFSALKTRDTGRQGLEAATGLTNLSVAEEDFSFATAADILLDLYRKDKIRPKSDKESAALADKLLLYSWVGGGNRLQAALKTGVCSRESIREASPSCQLARARIFEFPAKPIAAAELMPDLEVAQEIAALERSGKNLSAQAAEQFNKIAAKWTLIDPLTRYAFLPRLSKVLEPAISAERKNLVRIHPMKLDEASLKARLAATEELEAKLSSLWEKMPSSLFRQAIMKERAGLYEDLAGEIMKFKAPAGLAGADLSAFKQTLQEIAHPFEAKEAEFRDRLGQAGKNSVAIDLAASLNEASRFSKTEAEQKLFQAIQQAQSSKNVPLLALLVREGNARMLLSPGMFNFFAAVLSHSVGEKSEALGLLESATETLDKPDFLELALLRSYGKSGNKEKLDAAVALWNKSRHSQQLRLSEEEKSDLRTIAQTHPSAEIQSAISSILTAADAPRIPAGKGDSP